MEKQLVFDVGVNDGDDTAYYLNRGYKVVGIEADPLLVEQLSRRFAEPIARGDLQLLNLGVAAEDGEAQFWVSERSIWSSFSREMASRDGLSCHPITVPTKPFDAIVRQYGVPYYCKIDIEGYDRVCLSRLAPELAPRYISVEMHRQEGDADIERLRELGYAKFKIISQVTRGQPEPWILNTEYALPWRLAVQVRNADRRMRGAPTVNGWAFSHTSSGPFAEDTPGPWRGFDATLKLWKYLKDAEPRLEAKGLHEWFDVHATH